MASTTTSASYISQQVSAIPAQYAVPYLDVIATLSVDRKTIFVTVVNKDLTQPITANINLGTVYPTGLGTAWTLQGTAADSNTGTDPIAGVTTAPQAHLSAGSRFYAGSATEVQLTGRGVSPVASTFSYMFPAASLTSLEIPLNSPAQ